MDDALYTTQLVKTASNEMTHMGRHGHTAVKVDSNRSAIYDDVRRRTLTANLPTQSQRFGYERGDPRCLSSVDVVQSTTLEPVEDQIHLAGLSETAR